MIHPKVEQKFSNLEKSKSRLIDILNKYDHEVLNKQPQEGKWSALQIVYHLITVEQGTKSYIEKKIQKPELIPSPGLGNFFKMKLLAFVLWSPIKVKAPDVLAHPPKELELAPLEHHWEEARADFYKLIEHLPEPLTRKAIFKHPMVGRIDLLDTMRFITYHYQHHVRQIEKILRDR